MKVVGSRCLEEKKYHREWTNMAGGREYAMFPGWLDKRTRPRSCFVLKKVIGFEEGWCCRGMFTSNDDS